MKQIKLNYLPQNYAMVTRGRLRTPKKRTICFLMDFEVTIVKVIPTRDSRDFFMEETTTSAVMCLVFLPMNFLQIVKLKIAIDFEHFVNSYTHVN